MFKKLFSKSNKPVEKNILVLDIGTENIKALIIKKNSKEREGNIVAFGVEGQRLGDMHGGAVSDIAAVQNNCHQVVNKMFEALDENQRIDEIVVGIAGELIKGNTTTINYERQEQSSQINLSELKNIVHKVQWQAFKEAKKNITWETGFSEIEIKLLNSSVVDVKIDGYRISNPLGFQGKNIAISIFNAFAPLTHFGSIKSISDSFTCPIASIIAEPYAVSRCLTYEDSGDFSAIFIDIGGGTTDIAVVRTGCVEGTKSFSLGGRSFTKRIAQELQIGLKEAENIKLSYSANQLFGEERKVVRTVLEEDTKTWLMGIELSLSEFENVDIFPSRILLCGG